MKRWPRKKLVDIAAVQMGQSPPGESYNSDGVGLPFFQGKAEFGEEYPTTVKWCSQPSRIADAGDILLSVRAPVGPTNFAPERCCIGRGLAAIRAEPKACNPRYVRYYLNRFETEIAALGVGSTFSAINRNNIERLEVPVPPLPEQRAIVRYLDHMDRRIRRYVSAKRKLIALLEEEKQAVINQAVTRGLDPNVRLKPSGVEWLGDVPEHWERCRLRNLVSVVTTGSRGWSSYASDTGPLFIRVANLNRGSLQLRFDDTVSPHFPYG